MDNSIEMYWLDVAIIYFALGAPFGVLRITAKRKVTPFAYLRMASGYLLWPLVAIRNVARFFITKPAPLQKPARKQGKIQAALWTSNDVSEPRARRSWLPASVTTFFRTTESVPSLTRGLSRDLDALRTELEKALFPNAAASSDSAATRTDSEEMRHELYAFREVFYRYTGLAATLADFNSSLITHNSPLINSSLITNHSSLIRSACLARRDRQKLEAQLVQARQDLIEIVQATNNSKTKGVVLRLCRQESVLDHNCHLAHQLECRDEE